MALGIIITFVAVAIGVAVVAILFHAQTYTSPAGTQVAKSVGTVTVNGQTHPARDARLQHLSRTRPGASTGSAIHPGGNPSWPAYGPTNEFQVPAHALVTVTVRQYDSGGTLNNPWFATVRGTVGGVARINGRLVHSIDPDNVGHTFTVRGAPGTDPGFFVNVPLPAVPGNNQSDNGQYVTVVFSFVSGLQGRLRLELRVPLRDLGGRLRRPHGRLRVHVGVPPCRLTSP